MKRLTAFTAGLVATLPVTVLALPGAAARGGLQRAAWSAFVDAALVEEAVKLLALLWLSRQAEFRRPQSVIVAGFFMGLGFAAMEMLLLTGRGLDGLFFRLFTAVPCHAFLGVVMASYVARYVGDHSRAALLKAFALPLLLHGLYDLPLMTETAGDPSLARSGALLSALVLALLAAWSRFLLLAFARIQPVEVRPVAERQFAPRGACDQLDAA